MKGLMRKRYVTVTNNVYLFKLPVVESHACWECGHVRRRLVWKSFIKIGENKIRRDRIALDDVADSMRASAAFWQKWKKENDKRLVLNREFYEGRSSVSVVTKGS